MMTPSNIHCWHWVLLAQFSWTIVTRVCYTKACNICWHLSILYAIYSSDHLVQGLHSRQLLSSCCGFTSCAQYQRFVISLAPKCCKQSQVRRHPSSAQATILLMLKLLWLCLVLLHQLHQISIQQTSPRQLKCSTCMCGAHNIHILIVCIMKRMTMQRLHLSDNGIRLIWVHLHEAAHCVVTQASKHMCTKQFPKSTEEVTQHIRSG